MKQNAKRVLTLCFAISTVLFVVGCTGSKDENASGGNGQQKTFGEGLKYGEIGNELFVSQTKILATIRDDERPAAAGTKFQGHGDSPVVKSKAPVYEILFGDMGRGVAYKVVKGNKVAAVFNGKSESFWKDIGGMAISPDGRRFAYTALDDNNIWHLIIDSKDTAEFHHLGMPVFSPDGRHVTVQASANMDWYIVLDEAQSKGGKYSFDQPVFSADSTKIAYIENLDDEKKKLYIADLRLKSLRIIDSVVSPLYISPDKKQVAVGVVKNDRQRVIRIAFDRPDVVNEGLEYDWVGNMMMSSDGKSLAYLAMKGNVHYLVLNNRDERLESTPLKPPVISPSGKEVAVPVASNRGMRLHKSFNNSDKDVKGYDDIDGIVYSVDGGQFAFAATKSKSGFVVVNGKEGPPFDKVVKPVFSPDGKRVVYRARKDGKRFVVVADTNGKTMRQHPAYDQVFQPVFTPDGKSVAYGVQDGKKLIWAVEKL